MGNVKFLDLGRQPLANYYISSDNDEEIYYDLTVNLDEDTKLVSIKDTIDRSIVYTDKYVYHSSGSATMRAHFASIAKLINNTNRNHKILEIGSNDGVFAKHIDPKNITLVEPCHNFYEMTTNMGYKTHNRFWDIEFAHNELQPNYYDVIFSANSLCHIKALDNALDAIKYVLKEDGVFITENPDMLSIINQCSYDQFYIEHVNMFSLLSISNILKKHDLYVNDIEKLNIHGGSYRLYISKQKHQSESALFIMKDEIDAGLSNTETYLDFASRVESSRSELTNILQLLKSRGTNIISYGATAKSNTIFNYCNIGPNLITYISDNTPSKYGKLSPGMHIPVIRQQKTIPEDIDYAFLGAWNFRNEILDKEREFIRRGGKFITHVPMPHII